MISFHAFHREPERKAATLAAVAAFAHHGGPVSPIRMLAGGPYDLPAAHQASGFPAPLLLLCEAVCQRLPAAEGHRFVTGVLTDADCETDVSDVAERFVEDLLNQAVARHGPKALKAPPEDFGALLDRISNLESEAGDAHFAHAERLRTAIRAA